MAEGTLRKICKIVQRKRAFEPQQLEQGSLRRCLNCWDLTSLGVGSTLGVGIYVLIGVVALKIAGPSILISFAIAAITSLFAGLCYAEFGARVPLAGSAFIYTYVTIGELLAFIVGWNNILELVFGTASVARGFSAYIDTLTNHAMSEWFQTTLPVGAVAPYFDLLAFGVVLTMGTLLALGVRESTSINNVFSSINVLVILFIVIAGSFKANAENWFIPAEQVPAGFGSGGFFPYGVWGTLRGAAVCFYGFVGFDVVNSSGEEVRDPQCKIPIAILSILSIVFVAYAAVSIVVTMMVPYYTLANVAALSVAFHQVGWEWAKWIVTVGAIFGIITSLYGSLFPLPRLLYSMASDGLFVHWFKRVSSKNQSPIIGTIVPTVVIAILAALLDLEQLVLVMCIGTLFSYTIVAICVVLLRYRSDEEPAMSSSIMKQIIGRGDKSPSRDTSLVINVAMFVYLCLCVAMALVCIHTSRPLVPAAILHVFAIATVIVIALQPPTHEKLSFKVPLVPFIPCLSIYANVHLMVIINWQTWVRVLVWILIGIFIYFICICCYKQNAGKQKDDTMNKLPPSKNSKPPVTVQIVVEAPTPPSTILRSNGNDESDRNAIVIHKDDQKAVDENKTEEIITEQLNIDNNEEKEAKIIDLLDQVLQAEEDSYGEVISLKESIGYDDDITQNDNLPHRKSLSELSDVGSDISGNQVLSKYDVIAQVHREDLPKLNEEEEKNGLVYDNEEIDIEAITAFNESETNSRTDESGYSDTIDKPADESLDENIPYIPPPPPLPLDDNYFSRINLTKYNTVPSKYIKVDSDDDDEISEPRLSNQSNNSQSDGNMRFGSDRQIKFMTKLNDIFQKTIVPNEDTEEPRRRSQSTGNVADVGLSISQERQPMFLDLKKELLSRDVAQSLRPVAVEKVNEPANDPVDDNDEDKAMSREDLKNKLENIFALNGPQLVKPRLMKSNPPTPDDSYQTDISSSESIAKLPKMDKNDTLKRQKEKFGDVLNSFRLSMNKDDEV